MERRPARLTSRPSRRGTRGFQSRRLVRYRALRAPGRGPDSSPDAEPADAPRAHPYAEPLARRAERLDDEAASVDRDVPFIDYVRVIYKRRRLAVAVFLTVFGTVAAYTFTSVRIYEAKTRLLIESDERNVVSFQQVVEEDQTKADYYQTQYNVLQSRALARKTLDDLKLWHNDYFASARGGLWASVGRMFTAS